MKNIKTFDKFKDTNPVLSVGVINITTGVTSDKWSIYENKGLFAYLASGGFLILGAEGSFQKGDSYDLIGDQTRRSLSKRGRIIDSHSCANKEEFIAWLKSHKYDYTPIRSFRKRPEGTKKLSTSYVLK